MSRADQRPSIRASAYVPRRARKACQAAAALTAADNKIDASVASYAQAVARYEAGDHKKAFALLRKVMRAQIDPEPIGALLRDPRYHDLCIRYRIPIELSDEDARTLA